jgi:hypothetical protein
MQLHMSTVGGHRHNSLYRDRAVSGHGVRLPACQCLPLFLGLTASSLPALPLQEHLVVSVQLWRTG